MKSRGVFRFQEVEMELTVQQKRDLAREEQTFTYMRERAAAQYANLQKLRARYGVERTSERDNSEFTQQSHTQESYTMDTQEEKRVINITPEMALQAHEIIRTSYRSEAGEVDGSPGKTPAAVLKPDSVMYRAQLREVEAAIRASGLTPRQINRALTTVTGPAATGSTVLPPWVVGIFQLAVEEFGRARALFTPATLIAKETAAGQLVTDTPAYWTTEGASIIPGEFVIGGAALTAAKLTCLLITSMDFVEDAGPALMEYDLRTAARSMAIKEDQAAFIGDGTATYGEFTGIARSSTNIHQASAGRTTRSTIGFSDLLALKRKVPAAKRFNACFMLGPDFWDELCDKTDLGLRPIISIDGSERYLYGSPVELVPAMDSITDAAGAPCALYGDPRHCVFGTRRGLDVRPSEVGIAVSEGGATLSNALQADLMIYSVTERVAFDLLDKSAIAVLKTAAA